ncbi:hypothetical protein Ocin01_15793 [Orchesella cincta]|uniref:CUB domain-containing protein n=1 Tax=Orchesella cincta TaxID=48709 RepID=A0A1D2MD34_ORCCI|nr:hypothetical protein Ocin01_15793 [Orchesella cincta]
MRTSIVFLICCIFQSTIGRNVDLPFVETASPPTVPFEALTECGQTIVADSGIIEYKLNQSYDAGELCVFVIRYTQGSGWEYLDGTFSLEADGFSDSDPFAIKILRFYDGYASEVFSLGPTERIVSFYGNGAVIVFKTRSNTGTGFRLSFSAVALSPPSDYLLGKDVVLNSRSAESSNFRVWAHRR